MAKTIVLEHVEPAPNRCVTLVCEHLGNVLWSMNEHDVTDHRSVYPHNRSVRVEEIPQRRDVSIPRQSP